MTRLDQLVGRIACRLFGHNFGPWIGPFGRPLPKESRYRYRRCRRCGKVDEHDLTVSVRSRGVPKGIEVIA